MNFFASAPLHITDLLAQELREFGAKNIRESQSGVYFSGSLETLYTVCLWSRIANKVFLPLKKFSISGTEDLYHGVFSIDWDAHFSFKETFAIKAVVSNSCITNSRYAVYLVKDAVVDYFREKGYRRPSVDAQNPDIEINLLLQRNDATVSLNLSGPSLHQRNYRTGATEAPLKENLAAALLIRADWPAIAASGGAFWDPMCGSGTLPIEAACIAGDIAPGIFRSKFGFFYWRQHSEKLWKTVFNAAVERKMKGVGNIPEIYGSDSDSNAIRTAVRNAAAAHLNQVITFKKKDLFSKDGLFFNPGSNGLIAVNPPYGKRLGDLPVLSNLHRKLGEILLSRFMGWRFSMMTENTALAKQIPLRASKIHVIYNGPLKCKLFHFSISEDRLYRKHLSDEAGTDTVGKKIKTAYETPGAVMFANRLRKNYQRVQRWAEKQRVRCFRVYDADMPGYSVAVDLFENKWIHIQEYAAPGTVDPKKAVSRLNDVVRVVMETFPVRAKDIYIKKRHRQRLGNKYTKLGSKDEYRIVHEGPAAFLVNFDDRLDIGLFLDNRSIRKLIYFLSGGKRFLNLFSYTGTATVMAALGGAVFSVSVDRSRTYNAWAERNFRMNKLDTEAHRIIRDECMAWLRKNTAKFDLIYVDPPTYSNSKSERVDFNVQRDHVALIRESMKHLTRNGVLIFSNNYKRFRFDAKSLSPFFMLDISKRSIPFDFQRNASIHNCWILSRTPLVDFADIIREFSNKSY